MAKTKAATATKDNGTENDANKPAGFGGFCFEFIEKRCRNVLVNTLRGSQSFRSRWSMATLNMNGGTDSGGRIQRMPEIPGLYFTVDPAKNVVTVTDPLDLPENKTLLQTINAVARDIAITGQQFAGVPVQKFELNNHEFKSFLLEIIGYHSTGYITINMIEGTLPDVDSVQALPGKELFDPRSNSHVQPKFVKDVEEYLQRLTFNNK
mgnify:CR=1 FL=1